MEREIRGITTPTGKKVNIKTYLTYGEWREIQSVYMSNVKIGVDVEGNTKMNDIDASITFKAQNKIIETLIVDIDGKKEDVLKTFLDLPKSDAEMILKELDMVQAEWTAEKKTK